jgi:hypothetical protein
LRKVDGDSIFVVNFQRSRDGVHFFINLGGQPTQIPDEANGDPNPSSLKEYQCVFRRRVGKGWPKALGPQDILAIRVELDDGLSVFEVAIRAIGERIRSEEAAKLLDGRLPFGCTAGRAALHLARLAAALGEHEKCRVFAELGLSRAGPGAIVLSSDLRKLAAASSG